MPFYRGIYIDPYYFIFIIPTLILALLAQFAISYTSKKYFKIANTRRVTGAMAADVILRHYGISDVHIEHVSGNLTDHFDPRHKVIRLSDKVYGGASISAVGIACHEAGHAAQHAQSYLPIKIRNLILPIANIGSTLWLPIFLFGLILSFETLIYVGIILFAVIALFQLVTLPIEINASRRAIRVIEETHLLTNEEIGGAKKVLTAAAFTYIAALLSSVAQLLRLLFLFGRRNND